MTPQIKKTEEKVTTIFFKWIVIVQNITSLNR